MFSGKMLLRFNRSVFIEANKRVLSSTANAGTSHRGRKMAIALIAGAGAIGGVTVGLNMLRIEADDCLHPPKYPWLHNGILTSLDHQSIRRGYQVYKEVCSACHSLNQIAFRNLIGVSHSEAEAKELAESYNIEDGPGETGEMFLRPGKLSDYFPNPYKNDEEARAANNGALPPDLSLITNARHGKEDYSFALLTGYVDPPAGITLREGLSYNPYFPGGAIGMPQQLFDDMIEYEDGTPATVSQMAKDVSVFLKWCTEPYFDDKKRMGMKAILIITFLYGISWYYKRHRWSVLKSRKLAYKPPVK